MKHWKKYIWISSGIGSIYLFVGELLPRRGDGGILPCEKERVNQKVRYATTAGQV